MSREKQIEEQAVEEMAKAMCGNGMSIGNCAIDDTPCELECVYGCCAERLYSKGYRKQEWISVDEALPKQWEMVLVFGDGIVSTDFISSMGRWYEHIDHDSVTHWMPLPEAPKMKGGAE